MRVQPLRVIRMCRTWPGSPIALCASPLNMRLAAPAFPIVASISASASIRWRAPAFTKISPSSPPSISHRTQTRSVASISTSMGLAAPDLDSRTVREGLFAGLPCSRELAARSTGDRASRAWDPASVGPPAPGADAIASSPERVAREAGAAALPVRLPGFPLSLKRNQKVDPDTMRPNAMTILPIETAFLLIAARVAWAAFRTKNMEEVCCPDFSTGSGGSSRPGSVGDASRSNCSASSSSRNAYWRKKLCAANLLGSLSRS